jgi:hypothetical protein
MRDVEREETIGADSKIKVGLLVALIPCVILLVASYMGVKSELSAIRSELNHIRESMSDRWSGSMMILWAERLRHENAGKLVVPEPQKVREDIPLPRGAGG